MLLRKKNARKNNKIIIFLAFQNSRLSMKKLFEMNKTRPENATKI